MTVPPMMLSDRSYLKSARDYHRDDIKISRFHHRDDIGTQSIIYAKIWAEWDTV